MYHSAVLHILYEHSFSCGKLCMVVIRYGKVCGNTIQWLSLMSWGDSETNRWFQPDVSISMLWLSSGDIETSSWNQWFLLQPPQLIRDSHRKPFHTRHYVGLKERYTFGTGQRAVFSLGVYHHKHQIIWAQSVIEIARKWWKKKHPYWTNLCAFR